jgi:ComF family protein
MPFGLFHERCPACGCGAAAGFCAVCRAALPLIRDPCPRCGLARPVAQCPRSYSPWLLDRVTAPLDYRPPLDGYVHALKYRGARSLGRALGLLLAAALRAEPPRAHALVPVPLHPRRLRLRGYNQALEIARTIGGELRLPVLQRGIRRPRATAPHTTQTASQRRHSAAAAFVVGRKLDGATVAIVDDVLTTGATANALARALLEAGAARCEAWVVARTPEKRAQLPNT